LKPLLGADFRRSVSIKLSPAVYCGIAFPLILTFSRREKEQPLSGFVKPVSLQAESSFSFAKTQGAFLPLPAGEGRGEGERKDNLIS
jgi:hypothetical protein